MNITFNKAIHEDMMDKTSKGTRGGMKSKTYVPTFYEYTIRHS